VIRYRDRSGARRRESTFTQDWQEAQRLLRERLQARDSNALDVIRKGEKLSLEQWADFFLENYSKPPVRAEKTHQVNLRVAKHLKNAFASRKLVDITADDIEIYLSDRLRKTVRVRTALGYRQMGVLKANHSSSGAPSPSAHVERGGAKNSFKPIPVGR